MTQAETGFIVNVEIPQDNPTALWWAMGNFGEDLRKERVSRGIALKDITAVTKISHQYLEALEEERFRALPGGIFSKGIVRGYASALGLDQSAWTERYLQAYTASGQVIDDDRSWMEFASNVGKARIPHSDAREKRLRWIGVILLLLVVIACAFLAVRYYGARAGWWPSLLPVRGARFSTRFAWTCSGLRWLSEKRVPSGNLKNIEAWILRKNSLARQR